MRLFVGNFDFETRLPGEGKTAGVGGTLPARLARLNAEMAPLWLAVAEEGDAIWCPEPIPEPFWSSLAERGLPRVHPISRLEDLRTVGPAQLVPWGWNADSAGWATRLGLRFDAPPLGVVRAANSRRYSAEWETQLGAALPGAGPCTSLADVEARLAPFSSRRWVLKSEFSHAARERILGDGSTLSPEAAAWITKRLARDGVVFLEPWVDRVAEVGVQWALHAARPDEPTLEGVTELLTHPDGRYLGSRFAWPGAREAWMEEAVAQTRHLALDLGRRGYFGPLGIDAMLYREGDRLHVRPIQDVNVRWTMGRLSLGWQRLLDGHSTGAWFHGEIPQPFLDQPHHAWPLRPPLIGSAPPTYCTTVWIASKNL